MKNEIRLNLTEDEHIRLLEVLSVANETKLAVDVNQAWLKVPEQRMASVEVLAKLQIVRGNLFRLIGYLEEAGCHSLALVWVVEAIEIVKALQLEVWNGNSNGS